MGPCINLADRFGADYRITFDEAYDPKGKHTLDPWMMQIPCRLGTIYPHSWLTLAVECDRRNAARQLRALPGLQLWQDGDGEYTFLVPVDLFPAVAAIVHPRRRRRLTEEQKRRLAEANAPYRFRPAAKCSNSILEATRTA